MNESLLDYKQASSSNREGIMNLVTREMKEEAPLQQSAYPLDQKPTVFPRGAVLKDPR